MAVIPFKKTKLTPYFKETFNESMKRLDRTIQDKIKPSIEKITNYGEAGIKNHACLGEKFKGKRGGHLDGNFRIVFTICSECMKAELQNRNCENCKNDNTGAMFHFVGTHDEVDGKRR